MDQVLRRFATHQKKVIHRDIKPANMTGTSTDDQTDGQTRGPCDPGTR
jgi:serine/threonine protein kinase